LSLAAHHHPLFRISNLGGDGVIFHASLFCLVPFSQRSESSAFLTLIALMIPSALVGLVIGRTHGTAGTKGMSRQHSEMGHQESCFSYFSTFFSAYLTVAGQN
jgi:hypothetical protein